MTDRQALLSAAGKQRPYKAVNIKPPAMPGDIYLYFSCETNENEVLTRTGESVGFDFGLKIFLTGSERKNIISPLFFKQNAKLIVKANFKIPLYMMPNSNKFESVLNSIINKSNINLKLPGFSSPVASQEGFDYKGFSEEEQEQFKQFLNRMYHNLSNKTLD